MLENIREKSQGVVAQIILGFIILTFAVAGIGSYTNSTDTSVAEVNGEKISQQAFEQAYQQQRNRMAQQNPQMFEMLSANPVYLQNLRKSVLDNLINEKLLDQSTQSLAIRVSEERIKKTITQMQEFQVDGAFDYDRYMAVLNQAGFRESSDFRDYLRIQMARAQLSESIVSSEFSLPYQTKMVSTLRDQKRDLRVANIALAQFKAQVEVSEDEIKEYYQSHQEAYQNEEQVKVNYLTLDVNDIAKSINTSEADALAYYNTNIASYTEEEKRRISHILIESGEDAKAKITALLEKVNAGEDFAKLAKENSADTFSAENGGDLEWLEKGVMVPAFEEAALALTEKGQVSDIVETEFGFHIIKLTDFQAEQVRSFEDAKAEVMAKTAQEAAQTQFYDLQQELARVSFESPDSLDEASEVIKAKIQTSPWLKRSQNTAPFNESKVIETVFSDLVINENVNSDVIEVSPELAMVVHINEHQPAEVKPLAEVSEQIKTLLVNKKANEKAQSVADELLAKFTAGEDISAQLAELSSQFEDKQGVTRFGSDLDNTIVSKAFSLPHPSDESVSATNLTLRNGDVSLVQVTAVNEPEMVNVEPQAQEQFAGQLARSAYMAYVGSLSAEADISRRALPQEENDLF